MNDSITLSTNQNESPKFISPKNAYLKGMLAVFAPFLVVAVLGGFLGSDISFASALVINLAYLMAIVIATVVLKKQGLGWGVLGLARPVSWPKTIASAVGTFFLAVAALLAFQVLLMALGLGASDQSDYNPLTGNLPVFLTMVAAAWTLVAFGEEMLFRAFLINSLAGALGGLKARWVLAAAGSSLVFGLAHYDWGLAGIIETTLVGLIFGAVYLRTGRNLWVTIIAHALSNTLKFALVFAGWV